MHPGLFLYTFSKIRGWTIFIVFFRSDLEIFDAYMAKLSTEIAVRCFLGFKSQFLIINRNNFSFQSLKKHNADQNRLFYICIGSSPGASFLWDFGIENIVLTLIKNAWLIQAYDNVLQSCFHSWAASFGFIPWLTCGNLWTLLHLYICTYLVYIFPLEHVNKNVIFQIRRF